MGGASSERLTKRRTGGTERRRGGADVTEGTTHVSTTSEAERAQNILSGLIVREGWKAHRRYSSEQMDPSGY